MRFKLIMLYFSAFVLLEPHFILSLFHISNTYTYIISQIYRVQLESIILTPNSGIKGLPIKLKWSNPKIFEKDAFEILPETESHGS
jgi:hypothetical protein